MKLTDEKFRELRDEWYKRLKEAGFQDIEVLSKQDELIPTQLSPPTEFLRLDPDIRQIHEDYFLALDHHIGDENTVFNHEVDKYILTRYSEGAKIYVIAKELKNKGSYRHRHTIRRIIKRYEKKWNLR